jgi:hypothetical protein
MGGDWLRLEVVQPASSSAAAIAKGTARPRGVMFRLSRASHGDRRKPVDIGSTARTHPQSADRHLGAGAHAVVSADEVHGVLQVPIQVRVHGNVGELVDQFP